MSTPPPPAFNSAEPTLDAVYELAAGPFAAGELRVVSFEGREEMNGLYAFDVVFWAKDLDDAQIEGALLGLPAALAMHLSGGGARYVRGIVHALTLEGKHPGGRHAYRLSLAPKLWFLGKRVNSRIFQDQTVQEIVDVVLAEHGVAHDWNLVTTYAVRRYCVQYQESDLHFVTRLLAEEGIFFSFDHPVDGGGGDPATERLVLADGVHGYGPIDGDPGLVYRHQTGDGSMKAEENQVLDLRAHTRIEPTAVVMHDYDFQRPMLDLTSRAPAPGAPAPVGAVPRPLEVYEHHGEFEETDADAGHASVYLEQLRAGAREAHGVSVCRRLLPGHRFDLRDHEIEALDASWVVTHVHHRGVAAEGAQKKGTRVYENTFRCAPADVPHRPPRPARLTRQVLESATVVGPEGQEIFTDAYGRVKVQFHWDREGKRDESSSCWMRVMQAWAGTGWGFQFIPRIGMEVVVSFLGGDLDRPVVMGCVSNAANPPPYPVPGQAEWSGMRTHSTPGGGGWNEVSFNDRAGAEQLYLRAQRNLHEEVGLDRAARVARDSVESTGRDLRTEVAQHRHDATGGDHRITVNGGRSVAVAARDDLDVRGPRTTTIAGREQTRVTGALVLDVDGGRAVTVGGSDAIRVRGDVRAVIDGEETRDVLGDARFTFSKACAVNAAGGVQLSVGTKSAPASAETKLSGDLVLRGAGTIEISSDVKIRITVGSTVVTLDPKEVRIEAEKITLNAKSIEATGEKGSLSVGEKVEIKGDSVKLASKDNAILELDKEAKLDGQTVKIKPGLAAEMAKREEREQQAKTTDPVEVSLFDLAGGLITGAPYEVSFPGYHDKGTAADGTVKIPAFPDVERALVRWGRPKDKREDPSDPEPYEHEMEVFLKVDAADADESLRRKLSNLGHPARDLATAVRHYQDSLGADRTGKGSDVQGDVDGRHATASPVKFEQS
jgi:type VI secretion system secreted protein VgrG